MSIKPNWKNKNKPGIYCGNCFICNLLLIVIFVLCFKNLCWFFFSKKSIFIFFYKKINYLIGLKRRAAKCKQNIKCLSHMASDKNKKRRRRRIKTKKLNYFYITLKLKKNSKKNPHIHPFMFVLLSVIQTNGIRRDLMRHSQMHPRIATINPPLVAIQFVRLFFRDSSSDKNWNCEIGKFTC